MMTRAAQTHQAGQMRPTGRVFETPVVNEWKRKNKMKETTQLRLPSLRMTECSWK